MSIVGIGPSVASGDPLHGLSAIFNVKTLFGALGDGVTDDTAALVKGYASAEASNGILFLPPGTYRYSSKIFDIKNKVNIIGAGKRQTFLKPMSTFHDYAITITDCWRNGEEQADDTVFNSTAAKGGVRLEGFSIIGDRTVGGNRGIQTIGTNDFLTLRDIDFVLLDGTALQCGIQADAFNTSCIRECFFENIQFELSGNLTEPAFDLGGGPNGGSGDGTNDCTFVHLNFANNKGIHWRISGQTTKSTRGLSVYGMVVNGDGPEASSPTPADLIQITGNVGSINFNGLFLSGTATVATVPYAGININSNAAGTPDRIKIQGDIVSLLGDGYVINQASGVQIIGTSGVAGAGVTELKVAAGQPGTFNLQYDVISQQSVAARQALLSIGDEAAASAMYGSFRRGAPLTSQNNATPDVRNVEELLIINTVPTSITDFNFGGKAHLLSVVCGNADVGTTLVHGAPIILRGAVSRFMLPNETVLFQHNGSTQWLEVGDATYQILDGWAQNNVAASQTNVELVRADGRWTATRAGSVTGISVISSLARTAGTLTVKVFKNTGLSGAVGAQLGTLTAVLDGTNTSRMSSLQKPGTTFAAGDELFITVTTDAGWLPVTANIRCTLEVVI